MPTLIVRGVPEAMHKQLKEAAKRHHRSLSGEVLSALEEHMALTQVPALDLRKLPAPLVPRKAFQMTPEWIKAAINEGRE